MIDKIKEYWDERAASFNDTKATTNDVWLRELEIRKISNALHEIQLPKGSKILDVGCGDGYSTLSVAKKFPELIFKGIDFSENMIKMAKTRLDDEALKNVFFTKGNVLELEKMFDSKFDVVLTDRCLINLNTIELQKIALETISKILKNSAYYIGIENFIEGHNEMNKTRCEMGLDEIPIRWHNLFFKENEFKDIASNYFNIISIENFSSAYYFATRVIYSKMCKMKNKKPDYNHEIHQLAIDLPTIGNYSPIKLVILQKKGIKF